jgi:hypothetical protein
LLFLGFYLTFFSLCSNALHPLADVPSDCKTTDFPDYVESWWNHPSDRYPLGLLIVIFIVFMIIPGAALIYKSEKKSITH